MEHAKRFTGRAQDYTLGRPSYPEALLDHLYRELGLSERSIIADIGAGTGKFTRQLLERGSTVYAVEPNEDMRTVAIRELSGYKKFYPVSGSDVASGLMEHSVDLITVAQAFHWFDMEGFRRECQRILKPGGGVALIWNMRDTAAPENAATVAVYQKYCTQFQGFNAGLQMDAPRIGRFFEGKYTKAVFPNLLLYNKEKFIHRSLSSSYALKPGQAQYETFLAALEDVFERYALGGTLTVANETVVYSGVV